jgi:hypothetical protein
MNVYPLVVSWAVLATVVLGLAIYRNVLSRREDDYIHLDSKIERKQQAMAQKLQAIDKWGKLLTIVAAIFSLVLFAVFLYNGWNESGRIAQ